MTDGGGKGAAARMYPKTKSKRVQRRKNQATDLPVMERLATELLSDRLAGRADPFCCFAHDDNGVGLWRYG